MREEARDYSWTHWNDRPSQTKYTDSGMEISISERWSSPILEGPWSWCSCVLVSFGSGNLGSGVCRFFLGWPIVLTSAVNGCALHSWVFGQAVKVVVNWSVSHTDHTKPYGTLSLYLLVASWNWSVPKDDIRNILERFAVQIKSEYRIGLGM